jgi:primosomal protein N' (replication factor Y)
MTGPLYARVAVPRPLHRTFIYRVPEELADAVAPGSRVVVPFGRRELVGWVHELTRQPGALPERVREVIDAPDPEPALNKEVLELCRWVAAYYAAPLGLTCRAALPAALTAESAERLHLRDGCGVGGELADRERALLEELRAHRGPVTLRTIRRDLGRGPWSRVARRLAERGALAIQHEAPDVEPPSRSRQVVALRRGLPSLRERDELFGRARRQRELYEYLESVGGSAEVAHVTDQLGMSRSVVHGLADKGLAEVREERVTPEPLPEFPASTPEDRLVPTEAQKSVLRHLAAAAETPEPGVYVLKGVTSSGKTLVYIELLRELVGRRGRGAIVLVPEIALTPQTMSRFRSAFDDQVALLHSGLSDAERYETWQAARDGRKRIVVGARSAVFAPVRDLGAIILDEEHEGSYKQSDPAPRYHAREVAVVRAARAGALCLLGSATPSLESWDRTRTGRWKLLELPERIGQRPLPPVRVVDLREERKRRDPSAPGPAILSSDLRAALEERLTRGEQSILLLNRRGYAAFIQCRACGAVRACRQCNVSLTYHRRPRRLVCHHCNEEQPVPDRCPECGSNELDDRGVGTEQVERVLEETFPRARTARMDVDTTSGKWAHHEILASVGRGDVDILLGTQMIAKGLDFPNVTLVGVINADVGLNLPDFRASERTFQLLTQVAGRAGRGERGGGVFVQTALPGHYATRFAIAHDYDGFAAREMEERSGPEYPPHARLTNIVISGAGEVAVQEAAEAAARWLAGLFGAHSIEGLRIVGPAPCPIDRIRGRWRWHLLLKGRESAPLGRVLRYFARRFEPGGSDLRVEIDRDPTDVM